MALQPHLSDRSEALVGSAIVAVAAGAAWLHWRRFAVPITVAAGASALAMVVIAALPAARDMLSPLLLVAGLAMFALTIRWDLNDPERRTRRGDVAFWLHLVAASLTALVIGSALLSLSAFWQLIRHGVVGAVGDLGRRLPPIA
jgi:hypothetical protein